MRTPRAHSWLFPLLVATLGIYLLFVALAVGGLPSGHWALYLVPAAVACFVLAGAAAVRDIGHAQKH